MARIVLVGAVILPPTLLMGGSLPLFCRQFVQSRGRIGATVGRLYALNTLGAAGGCAAAGFVLLPALGLRRTLWIGALLSLVAGAAAAASRPPAVAATAARERRRRGPDPWPGALVPALCFGTGFVAVGYEVLWTRFLALLVRTTVHTYTLSLTVVLLGLVLGSWMASWVSDRVHARATLFGILPVLGGLTMLSTMLLPPATWRDLGSETCTCMVLALAPAALSGAAFTLAVRLLVEEPGLAAGVAGALSAVNTQGEIAGSVLVGFVALPHRMRPTASLPRSGQAPRMSWNLRPLEQSGLRHGYQVLLEA